MSDTLLNEKETKQKTEYLEMAERLNWLSSKPPRSFHDALQNRGNLEQVEGDTETPCLGVDLGAADAPAVGRQVRLFIGNAQSVKVDAGHAARLGRSQVPCEAVVGEVGQRIAQGRQFPVEHRQHARLDRMKYQVVDPEVTVNDAAFGVNRYMVRQPIH